MIVLSDSDAGLNHLRATAIFYTTCNMRRLAGQRFVSQDVDKTNLSVARYEDESVTIVLGNSCTPGLNQQLFVSSTFQKLPACVCVHVRVYVCASVRMCVRVCACACMCAESVHLCAQTLICRVHGVL